MTTFQHFGLYFTPEHVQIARKERERDPFRAAWDMLLDSDAHPGGLPAIQLSGLRYRFNDDSDAGREVVEALQSGMGLSESIDELPVDLGTLGINVILAQCFELTRDHPAWTAETQLTWKEQYAMQLHVFNHYIYTPLVERIWRGLVNIAAGVLFESQENLKIGINIYHETIENEIRPEGYLPKAVEGNDGGSLYRQMMAVNALVLMAEAASHIGIDLWGYSVRGVSVVTAASYLLYYYYYPDQWRWDTIAEEEAKYLFAENGAFLEMLNHHARPKDLKLLLDDLRPIYNLPGGLTTLSHALPARKGLFG